MSGVHKSKLYNVLENVLTKPIAFHRVFVQIGGGLGAGIMLSQAFYWTPRSSSGDGWFYKTQAEWEKETGATRWEQETARKRLRQIVTPSGKHLWEEQLKGVPAKLYYRVNLDALVELFEGLDDPKDGPKEDPKDDSNDGSGQYVGLPHTESRKSDDSSEVAASKYVGSPHTGKMDSHKLEEGNPTNKVDALPRTNTETSAKIYSESSAERKDTAPALAETAKSPEKAAEAEKSPERSLSEIDALWAAARIELSTNRTLDQWLQGSRLERVGEGENVSYRLLLVDQKHLDWVSKQAEPVIRKKIGTFLRDRIELEFGLVPVAPVIHEATPLGSGVKTEVAVAPVAATVRVAA